MALKEVTGKIDANKLLAMIFKKGVSGGASCSSGRLSLQG